MNGKTAAVIPARGGSKRIPNKNKKIFNGKPMIQWTIEAALSSKAVDYVIVSSDDDQILEIAAQFDQVIAIKRPDELATDTASINDAIRHALTEVEHLEIKNLMLLQPPCPLKKTEDIDNAMALFQQEKYASVVSVTEVEHPTDYAMLLDQEQSLDEFYEHLKEIPNRSQEFRKEYRLNGVIYITTVDNFMQHNTLFNAPGRAYVMPRDRSIDIDLPVDFVIAEALAQYKGEH